MNLITWGSLHEGWNTSYNFLNTDYTITAQTDVFFYSHVATLQFSKFRDAV